MTLKERYKTMHEQKQKLEVIMNQASLYYEFLIRFTQFLLSVSIFSFFFLNPSWLPYFLHNIASNFSIFSSQLVSYATDKTYIFLLCNGILVFVAKFSTRPVDSPQAFHPETTSTSDNDIIYKAYNQTMERPVEESSSMEGFANSEIDDENVLVQVNEAFPVEENHGHFEITQEVQDVEEVGGIFNGEFDNESEYVKEEPELNTLSVEEEEQNLIYDYREEYEDGYDVDYENEQEEEEDGIANMSTEELNRKFDEFIRKMKEELRFEARQQLIAV